MAVSEETYELVALEDGDEQWELVCGRLRRKPGMTLEHNAVMSRLTWQLNRQLDEDQFSVRTNSARTRVSSGSFYVPDVAIIPREAALRQRRERPEQLEVYDEPLPLVVEVWSPSTGDYDVETKLPEYQRRGDREIWRIHPYERTLTAWRRRADGSYEELRYRGGTISPLALPHVTIDIAR